MNSDLGKCNDQAKDWLFSSALPLWSVIGRNAAVGGFVEKIGMDGQPETASRRVRVSARQAYVFAEAGRLGWTGPWAELQRHALVFLKQRGLRPDGALAAWVSAEGDIIDAGPDLYDQAFYLFALANAFQTLGDESYREDARKLLVLMRTRMKNPAGGFEEGLTRKLPLRSNPHMHLLEAALAWMAADPSPEWRALGDEMIGLARKHFIDKAAGFLLEEFDGNWQPLHAPNDRPTEPGHNFEWAWLLFRWQKVTGDDTRPLARRLIDFAETKGVDEARKVAVNQLAADGRLLDAVARMWPQTERLKAALAHAADSQGEEKRLAEARAAEACAAIFRYLDTPVKGLWRDKLNPDGSFVEEPAPASTFYHIICAFSELRAYVTSRNSTP